MQSNHHRGVIQQFISAASAAAIGLALVGSVSLASPPAWEVTVLDGGTLPDSTGSPCVIGLDSRGRPHIAYTAGFQTGHNFRFAWHDGNQWNFEIFDDGVGTNVGAYMSLQMDSVDRVHLAYTVRYDSETSWLNYAVRENGEWTITTVRDSENIHYVSLALDSNDQPRIAYYSSGPWRDLWYAQLINGVWETEPVETVGWVGYDCSLAIDSNDKPHIAYRYGGSPFYLKYAHHDGTGWQIETANDQTPIGYGISIDLDSSDRPHIAHTSNLHTLHYTWYDGAQWRTDDLGPSARASPTSIVMDSRDRPHITYQWAPTDDGPFDHKYTVKSASGWRHALIDRGYGSMMSSTIVLDTNGVPQVALGRRYNLYEVFLVYARLNLGSGGRGDERTPIDVRPWP